MIKTSLKPDVNSCFSWFVLAARRHDLAAIIRESNLFRVVYAAKIDLEEITELNKYDSVIITLRGKTTKNLLSAADRDELLRFIRESNANLN